MLGGFIIAFINLTPKHRFLTRLSCVNVYSLSIAEMCAVFWDAAFWGRPPEFTRSRLASDS